MIIEHGMVKTRSLSVDMLRKKKPEGTDADEPELTLADIAKTLTALTVTVTLVKTALDTQVKNHDQVVKANAENHKDLKK